MPRNFTLALLPIALFAALATPAQPINWDSVRADYITKYQPQQVPAWLFPIIFEEGGGQRDTIYLGYDPNAQDWGIGTSDTIFGEDWQIIDTSRFNAHWEDIYPGDSAFKVTIRKTITLGSSISFYKGLLPLKMYWDQEAFYSDSLPFADQAPAPRVQGELGAYMYSGDPNGMYCPETDFVLLSDTSLAYGSSDGICTATDSLVFFDLFGGSVPSVIYSFGIRPWTGYPPLGIPQVDVSRIIEIYPNPATDQITLSAQHPGRIQVINLYGQTLIQMDIDGTLQIDVSRFAPGFYFALYRTGSQQHVIPIVLTK